MILASLLFLFSKCTIISLSSYVYGPGGLLLWEITSTGETNRYHTDQLGSIRAITNSQGAVVATYEYDPYGNLISSTGSIATRSGYFGYAGEYTDRESKLVYLRARYYDPSTQQFINRDPLVGASGEPYGYVGGSPLNGRDPSGLWWETPLDILSLSADLLDIASNGLNWTNGIALAADVVGLALPVVGGLGFVIRGAARAGDLASGGARADNWVFVGYHGTNTAGAASLRTNGVLDVSGLNYPGGGQLGRGFYTTKNETLAWGYARDAAAFNGGAAEVVRVYALNFNSMLGRNVPLGGQWWDNVPQGLITDYDYLGSVIHGFEFSSQIKFNPRSFSNLRVR